jgi:hypothetical protein
MASKWAAAPSVTERAVSFNGQRHGMNIALKLF